MTEGQRLSLRWPSYNFDIHLKAVLVDVNAYAWLSDIEIGDIVDFYNNLHSNDMDLIDFK